MSRIEGLLAEFAPNGVKFEQLGEVADVHTGSRPSNDDQRAGGPYMYMNGGVGPSGSVPRPNAPADTITIPSRGSVGVVGYQSAEFWCGPLCYQLRARHASLLTRFLYFALKSVQPDLIALQQTGSIPALNKAQLVTIRVPVPPVEVQREIVRVLDSFSALEAGLEAELEARRLQYAHYRDSLLTFSEAGEVRRIPMGELGTIFRGKRFTKADYVEEGGIGVIHYGEIYTEYGTQTTGVVSRAREDLRIGLRFASKGDVVLTDVGETVEDVGKAVAWMGDEDVAIHDHCYVIRSEVNPVYLSHYMQTSMFRAEKDRYVARTKVKTLLLDGLKRITVPVPSASEQARVVCILDKFDALVNDLSSGLPAELNARRKQYEYYRDKLLTFEEAP